MTTRMHLYLYICVLLRAHTNLIKPKASLRTFHPFSFNLNNLHLTYSILLNIMCVCVVPCRRGELQDPYKEFMIFEDVSVSKVRFNMTSSALKITEIYFNAFSIHSSD